MESSASSCGGQSTSNSPAHQPPVDAKKRHKMDAPSKKGDERDTALALPPEGWASSASPSQAEIEITMDSLPTCILSHVGSFTAGISLGGLCKATLEAFPALQYNINIASSASSFGGEEDPAGTKSEQHMGLPPTPGALATGRVISRISVTGCTDRKDSKVSGRKEWGFAGRELVPPYSISYHCLAVAKTSNMSCIGARCTVNQGNEECGRHSRTWFRGRVRTITYSPR